MPKRQKDLATVSFHYLQREIEKQGQSETQSFTSDEFDFLCEHIKDQPWPDPDDPETKEQLRIGTLVPFRNFERVNSRIARGTFQNSYSGHAFHNTEKGKISADSLNQREFQYLLYFSDDGKIFIGVQYLGNYGGYETLRFGLMRHFLRREGVRSYSFRKDVYEASTVRAKEIRINIASSGRDDEDNALTKRRMVVLQRSKRKDEAFEDAARDTFLQIMSSDAEDKKDQLVQLLSANNLMSAADEEVQNCILLAEVDGREKRFHVIGDSHFATRFPLSVPYNIDGHPEYVPTAEAILKALEREIIDSTS